VRPYGIHIGTATARRHTFILASHAMRGVQVGVDVGGTYTDLFFFDAQSRRARIAKVASTPADQAAGFMAGITSEEPARIATIVHGTTVGTNALLERKGGPIGIVTTKGFRDVLEMRRRDRPQTWGLWGTFVPLVPRDLRVEIDERTLADGTIRKAVDPGEAQQAARLLLARGATAVAIVFINSYANDANERAAQAAIAAVWPNPYIDISAAILGEIREFERASTAAVNAYLQPVIGRYIGSLEQRLARAGFAGQLLVVQSNGGVMSAETARRRPVRTALSGPAAGVIAAAAIARAAGFPNVITGDVGGTSFDVALIADGRSALAAESRLAFGIVVRAPMIEMTTIGAGGGSIASVDRSGLLQVGPQSAGSDPGPACYGGGNERPTLTDANLLLGRIDPERPIGDLRRFDVEAARRAIAREVGAPLGLDAMAAAEAIVRVANAAMAGAIRLVSIERGHDPKRFALMPFGGGGALHACALTAEVGLAQALVPRYPGVTSALGCLVADMRHDFVRTLNIMLEALDPERLAREIAARREEGLALLDRSGTDFAGRDTEVEFDMSYAGQTHTIAAALPSGAAPTGAAIRAAFEAAYRRAFGRLLPELPIRLLNLRVAVIGRRAPFDFALLAPAANASIARARRTPRNAWIAGEWREVPVFARLDLPVGAEIAGPAILEQPDTTVWIDPAFHARVDPLGNLILHRSN
jgi:N-methylhydantoinase A